MIKLLPILNGQTCRQGWCVQAPMAHAGGTDWPCMLASKRGFLLTKFGNACQAHHEEARVAFSDLLGEANAMRAKLSSLQEERTAVCSALEQLPDAAVPSPVRHLHICVSIVMPAQLTWSRQH